MPAPRPQSIPVFLLVRTTFQLLWQQKDDVLRLGLVPVLLCFAGFLFGHDDFIVLMRTMNAVAASVRSGAPDPTISSYAVLSAGTMGAVLVMSGILLVAYSLMTVNWLRFVLLGPMNAVGLGLNIGRPHWHYLLSFVGLVLVGTICLMVLSRAAALLPVFVGQIAVIAIFIGTLLVGARFVPFLVSIAIGQPMSLRESWTIARGNAVSLVVALLLTWAPFMVALYLVTAILSVFGFAQAAPVAMQFIIALFQVAAWTGQAGVLATAYRHMVGVRA
jgi:hypothetical protein